MEEAKKENDKQTQSGYIKAIIPGKGFGFITGDDGIDYFFHAQGVITPDFNQLREGMSVDFLATDGKKGPKGIGIVTK